MRKKKKNQEDGRGTRFVGKSGKMYLIGFGEDGPEIYKEDKDPLGTPCFRVCHGLYLEEKMDLIHEIIHLHECLKELSHKTSHEMLRREPSILKAHKPHMDLSLQSDIRFYRDRQ